MITDLALLRLLQLVSPALPIGMYSYSQGLETAVEEGRVSNVEQAAEWFSGIMDRCLSRVDLPLASRIYRAWQLGDAVAVENWSATLLAYRETSELRQEDRQTGQALAKVLNDLGIDDARPWMRCNDTTLATMFMLAALRWFISERQALSGLLWSWLENQVLCAVKLVPLGQTAGQQLLHELAREIPEQVTKSQQLHDDDVGGSVFALALAGSRHEVQYSRLFRS